MDLDQRHGQWSISVNQGKLQTYTLQTNDNEEDRAESYHGSIVPAVDNSLQLY